MLLSKFAHIGVREKTAVDLLNDLLDRNDVQQVLDPTFLLPFSQWLSFAGKSHLPFALPSKYILCYFIGDRTEYIYQIERIKQESGISEIILLPSLENESISIAEATKYKDADPFDFVQLIVQSALVCTDSFHACALSINLSKDFVIFKRFVDKDCKSQNSRIYDLLDQFGLNGRLYSDTNILWNLPIDYVGVQEQLQSLRVESELYLKQAIEN